MLTRWLWGVGLVAVVALSAGCSGGEASGELPDELVIERGPLTATCVRDPGVDAAEASDEDVPFGPPPDPLYRCEVQNLRDGQPFVEDPIRAIYRYYVEWLTPCLEGQGFAVDDPPDEQTFLETYRTADSWSPYDSVPDLPPDEWQELIIRCPQSPPIEYLLKD